LTKSRTFGSPRRKKFKNIQYFYKAPLRARMRQN